MTEGSPTTPSPHGSDAINPRSVVVVEEQKNPQWVVQLNPNGVAYPAQRAAEVCKEVVDLYFAALANQDLSKKPESAVAKFTNFGFVGNNLTAEQRRSLHENWILSKA